MSVLQKQNDEVPLRLIRAVLVTPGQFGKRFLDQQVEEERKKILRAAKGLRKGSKAYKKRKILLLYRGQNAR